jgi:hypothetical protein
MRPASPPLPATPSPAHLRCAASEGPANTNVAGVAIACIEVIARPVNERPC